MVSHFFIIWAKDKWSEWSGVLIFSALCAAQVVSIPPCNWMIKYRNFRQQPYFWRCFLEIKRKALPNKLLVNNFGRRKVSMTWLQIRGKLCGCNSLEHQSCIKITIRYQDIQYFLLLYSSCKSRIGTMKKLCNHFKFAAVNQVKECPLHLKHSKIYLIWFEIAGL